MSQTAIFSVVLYPQKPSGYTVICPEIPGCVTQGETYEEAIENAKGAIQDLMLDMKDRDEFIEALAVPNKIFSEIKVDI